MTRTRNKPILSWIKRAKIEIEREEELTIERAYELGKIRGKKETIDKACEWLKINYGHFDGSIEDLVADFRKEMED